MGPARCSSGQSELSLLRLSLPRLGVGRAKRAIRSHNSDSPAGAVPTQRRAWHGLGEKAVGDLHVVRACMHGTGADLVQTVLALASPSL